MSLLSRLARPQEPSPAEVLAALKAGLERALFAVEQADVDQETKDGAFFEMLDGVSDLVNDLESAQSLTPDLAQRASAVADRADAIVGVLNS